MTIDSEEAERIANSALEKNQAIDLTGLSNPSTFREAENFLESIFSLNKFDRNNPQQEGMTRPSFSIRNYTNQIQTIIEALESSGKSLTFPLTQKRLHALNPKIGQGQIVNPAAIILGPPPFFGGVSTQTLDVGISYNDPVTRNPGNTLEEMYNGTYVEARAEAGLPPFSVEGPKFKIPSDDGSAVGAGLPFGTNAATGNPSPQSSKTLDELGKELNIVHRPADGETRLDQIILADPYEEVNITKEIVDGVEIEKPDLSRVFNKRDFGPAFLMGQKGTDFFQPIVRNFSRVNAFQVNAQRNIDSFFSQEDVENGFMSELLDETTAVVPFYFEDLRAPGRYLYFRAFIESFTESLTPEWNIEKYYGRIDPVVTYMNTGRSINIGFKIVAMSKAGLTAMWRKINNLCKMVYPTFVDGIMAAGPALKIRVGDIIASETGGEGVGLPGILTSLEFDYSNVPWELETFNSTIKEELGKAPMWATISFNFLVIHQNNPSIDKDYNFDSKNFRRMGTLTRDIANLNEASQTQSESERSDTQDSGTPSSDGNTLEG